MQLALRALAPGELDRSPWTSVERERPERGGLLAVAGLGRPAGPRVVAALGLDLLRIGGGLALDLEHVVKLALLERGAELGDVAEAPVRRDRRRVKTPLAQLVDHRQGELPLRLVPDLLRDVSL